MAREHHWVPVAAHPCPTLGLLAPGHQDTGTPGPCQLAGKATAGGSGTVINKIIIRNKPQALAQRLHCHASAAYPALGSLAWQRWGSPNHTHLGRERARSHSQGEASGHIKWGKSPWKSCLGDLSDSCRQGGNPEADGASIPRAMMAPSTRHDNICSQKVPVLPAAALRLQTAPQPDGL